jgi:hypothetical protein
MPPKSAERVDAPLTAKSPDFERARRLALPVVLGVMVLVAFTPLRFLLSIFFAMWLHEFGHAATAWLCGSMAVPLPWVTFGGESRSVAFVALEVAALGAWGFFKRAHLPVVAGLGVLLIIGVLLPVRTVQMLVTFGGDGGALVLGTVLMLSVFLPDDARLSRGGLRWGFLTIGAGAFATVLATWVDARRDPGEIPFGSIEGVGLSDASKLVEVYGWSERALINRYLGLAAACVLVLVIVNFLRVRRRVS